MESEGVDEQVDARPVVGGEKKDDAFALARLADGHLLGSQRDAVLFSFMEYGCTELFIGVRRLETDAGADLSRNVAHVALKLGVGDFGRDDLPASSNSSRKSSREKRFVARILKENLDEGTDRARSKLDPRCLGTVHCGYTPAISSGRMRGKMSKRPLEWLLIGIVFAACSCGLSSHDRATGPGAAGGEGAPESLSSAGEQELRAMVASGRLPDLEWPNFSVHSADVTEFYKEGGYKLGWSKGGKPTTQALELIGVLQEADKKGLDSRDYDGARWPERLKALESVAGGSESGRVKFDVALTVSATRYLSDLHLGKVDPEVLHKDFDPEREKHNPGAFLWQDVIAASNVRDALAPVECPYPGYKRELVALQKYLQMAKEEVPDPLPQVEKPIQQGQNYAGLAKLVQRLQFLGDLPGSETAADGVQTYSGDVVDGVKRFQVRHGLDAEGKLGPQTIVELNRPMSDRVNQLRFSLERWRWLPHSFAQPPILVNIPEFLLRTMDAPGKPTLSMRVVVGRAMRTETPVLEEDMKYLVFWPYWNVPPSILRSEFIPKITKDPAYLQKNEYEVVTYAGQVVTDGMISQDILAQLRAGKLMVRQKPGPKNALGLVKFIFPNDKNIYLHSTPAQSLFGKTRRDFSHGCIRVVDPARLAEWVLRNNPGWTRERIDAAFKAEKEQQVNLTRVIPVLVLYSTAVAEEDGRIYFFEDIYGHDKEMAKLYAQAYGSHN